MEIKDKIVRFGNIRWKDAKWSLYDFYQHKQLDIDSLDLVALPEINIEAFKD